MKRRRSTDIPPFSEMVTRGNLDDRLDTIIKIIDAMDRVETERWNAHRAAHDVVAEALRDYKRDANEWRQTLTDLRGSFIPKAEYAAEHRALDSKLHGEVERVASKVESIDTKVDVNSGDIKDLHTEQAARRSVFSDSRNIVATIGIIIGVIATVMLLLDRLPRTP